MKRIRLFAAVIAVTALALTGCSSKPKETEAPKETQAKETQAPATEAKVAETEAAEAPAAETEAAEAAVVETEAAVVETEAAVAETEAAEAPAAETEAAVVETEAPVEETEAAVVETEAPVEETEEAVVETEAPVEETEAAVVETEAPVEETEEAVVETEEEADETEAPETEEEAEASGAMTYAEYVDAETDMPVTLEAYVQAKQAWYEDNADVGTSTVTIYAQDEDGGYFFYNVPCSEEDYASLEEGTKIRVSGYKAEWAGEVEVMDFEGPVEILEGDSFIADAVDVTDALADEDELIGYMNQKVTFTGMTVEPAAEQAVEEEESAGETTGGQTALERAKKAAAGAGGKTAGKEEAEDAVDAPAFLYGWDGSGAKGDDLYFKASVDGETYQFVIESSLCDEDSDVYQTVENLKVGDTIDMEGFLYWYEGAQPHITSVVVSE